MRWIASGQVAKRMPQCAELAPPQLHGLRSVPALASLTMRYSRDHPRSHPVRVGAPKAISYRSTRTVTFGEAYGMNAVRMPLERAGQENINQAMTKLSELNLNWGREASGVGERPPSSPARPVVA
jgi:hypothetical protein